MIPVWEPRTSLWEPPTIVDFVYGIRGPDSAVFCCGYETDDQCAARLDELCTGLIEVSHRKQIPLRILQVWRARRRGARAVFRR